MYHVGMITNHRTGIHYKHSRTEEKDIITGRKCKINPHIKLKYSVHLLFWKWFIRKFLDLPMSIDKGCTLEWLICLYITHWRFTVHDLCIFFYFVKNFWFVCLFFDGVPQLYVGSEYFKIQMEFKVHQSICLGNLKYNTLLWTVKNKKRDWEL